MSIHPFPTITSQHRGTHYYKQTVHIYTTKVVLIKGIQLDRWLRSKHSSDNRVVTSAITPTIIGTRPLLVALHMSIKQTARCWTAPLEIVYIPYLTCHLSTMGNSLTPSLCFKWNTSWKLIRNGHLWKQPIQIPHSYTNKHQHTAGPHTTATCTYVHGWLKFLNSSISSSTRKTCSTF